LEKDAIVAILGATVTVAGLVLVFIGFLAAQGEQFQNNKRKRIFKIVAKIGLIPFVVSLLAGLFCVCWLEQSTPRSYYLALLFFKLSLGSTLLYGVISTLGFL
jgi:uncharacterized membrane protein